MHVSSRTSRRSLSIIGLLFGDVSSSACVETHRLEPEHIELFLSSTKAISIWNGTRDRWCVCLVSKQLLNPWYQSLRPIHLEAEIKKGSMTICYLDMVWDFCSSFFFLHFNQGKENCFGKKCFVFHPTHVGLRKKKFNVFKWKRVEYFVNF